MPPHRPVRLRKLFRFSHLDQSLVQVDGRLNPEGSQEMRRDQSRLAVGNGMGRGARSFNLIMTRFCFAYDGARSLEWGEGKCVQIGID